MGEDDNVEVEGGGGGGRSSPFLRRSIQGSVHALGQPVKLNTSSQTSGLNSWDRTPFSEHKNAMRRIKLRMGSFTKFSREFACSAGGVCAFTENSVYIGGFLLMILFSMSFQWIFLVTSIVRRVL
jgi:hypothetical protein